MFLCVGTCVCAGVCVGMSVGGVCVCMCVCVCVHVRSIRATACQALDLEQIKFSINVTHYGGLGLLMCCFFLTSFSLLRCSIQ